MPDTAEVVVIAPWWIGRASDAGAVWRGGLAGRVAVHRTCCPPSLDIPRACRGAPKLDERDTSRQCMGRVTDRPTTLQPASGSCGRTARYVRSHERPPDIAGCELARAGCGRINYQRLESRLRDYDVWGAASAQESMNLRGDGIENDGAQDGCRMGRDREAVQGRRSEIDADVWLR